MVRLIQFVLASYALWFVFAQSDLPGWWKLRDELMGRFTGFVAFFFCPICSGFWCSLVMSFLLPFEETTSFLAGAAVCLTQGLAGAAAIFLIDLYVVRMERR